MPLFLHYCDSALLDRQRRKGCFCFDAMLTIARLFHNILQIGIKPHDTIPHHITSHHITLALHNTRPHSTTSTSTSILLQTNANIIPHNTLSLLFWQRAGADLSLIDTSANSVRKDLRAAMKGHLDRLQTFDIQPEGTSKSECVEVLSAVGELCREEGDPGEANKLALAEVMTARKF